jgi:hypothetical protein
MTPSIWESALVAALVSAAISLGTLWWTSRQQSLDRHRELFAAAFAVVADYREFVYIVRRRDANGSDRSGIHRDLSKVQAMLHRYEAMVRVEAPDVAPAYTELVNQTRAVAGGQIKKAWDLPAAANDTDMHVTDVDLSSLSPFEDRFLMAVKRHLSWRPSR